MEINVKQINENYWIADNGTMVTEGATATDAIEKIVDSDWGEYIVQEESKQTQKELEDRICDRSLMLIKMVVLDVPNILVKNQINILYNTIESWMEERK